MTGKYEKKNAENKPFFNRGVNDSESRADEEGMTPHRKRACYSWL
jgi:hypothetical protein